MNRKQILTVLGWAIGYFVLFMSSNFSIYIKKVFWLLMPIKIAVPIFLSISAIYFIKMYFCGFICYKNKNVLILLDWLSCRLNNLYLKAAAFLFLVFIVLLYAGYYSVSVLMLFYAILFIWFSHKLDELRLFLFQRLNIQYNAALN